jgi:ribosomal protein L27
MLLLARSLVRARAPDASCAGSLAASRPSPLLASAAAAAAAAASLGGVRFATSKAGGASKNGRDSRPKFLGVKRYGGERVEPGHIIVRQRGARVGIVESTASVGMGRDHTIFALKPGFVKVRRLAPPRLACTPSPVVALTHALPPPRLQFWYHRLRRKSFVEVVRTPPPQQQQQGAGVGSVAASAATPLGVSAAEAQPRKWPIVKVKKGDLPQLLKLAERAERAALASAASAALAAGTAPPGAGAVSDGVGGIEMSAEVRRQREAHRAARDAAARRSTGAQHARLA